MKIKGLVMLSTIMNIIGTNILRTEEFNEDLTALTIHFPYFLKRIRILL